MPYEPPPPESHSGSTGSIGIQALDVVARLGLKQQEDRVAEDNQPQAAEGRKPRLIGINHVALEVGDIDEALTFYGKIFDFSLRCRMRHALTLMRDHGRSVEQAGEAIGYAHPTSFTTAFRRHFGMRPIDVRRAKSR